MIGTLIGSSESLVAVLSAAPATTQPDGASDVLLVNGTVTITWINLGDY